MAHIKEMEAPTTLLIGEFILQQFKSIVGAEHVIEDVEPDWSVAVARVQKH